jgi:molybdenum cofactor synthesis domain-containing protein
MTPRTIRTAAALLVGNELLSGKVHEANLVELARTLRALGIALQRVVMVPDEVEGIARDVKDLSSRFDVLFTSGGVGPTHDDVTIESVALAFGTVAGVNESMAELLRSAYGDSFSEHHLRMAMVPEGADLLTTGNERWPTVVMRNVWIMPGVPEIFRSKLDVVRAHLVGPAPFHSKAVFTRADEGHLKPLLDRVVAEHPEVEVGSYPKWFDPTYKTKVTFDARDPARVDAAVGAFLEALPPADHVRTE